MRKESLTHIELFAGCGGMSLGLEAAGLDLYFANELSPMASETFCYNLLNENLQKLAANEGVGKKALWVKSNFPKDLLKNRLRENPFAFEKGKYSDLNDSTDLKGKLLVGDINQLLSFFENNKSIAKKIKRAEIDLLSGGPPCQSFSLAGRREKENQKNLLPLSFARFAGLVNPKIVLLENVKGITSPFTIDDKKYYAWFEVAKAFCLEGFVPICMMVNSKYFGIPQNRPRFILIAIRKDICKKLVIGVTETASLNILLSSLDFFNHVCKNRNSLELVNKNKLVLYDIEKMPQLFNGLILPPIVTKKSEFITAQEAIDDLMVSGNNEEEEKKPSNYVLHINRVFKCNNESKMNGLKNQDLRRHGFNVRARFRWFQIMSNLNGLAPLALKLLSGQEVDEEKKNLIFERIKNEKVLMCDSEGEQMVKIKDREFFETYIKRIQTRKHSQRAIKAKEPVPAQMTIPDDLCHYSPLELRTLTVREMARFQSFPDCFEFRSKITTGGDQRSFEVPQYTQVGNAVPPLLAYYLGNHIKYLLKLVENA